MAFTLLRSSRAFQLSASAGLIAAAGTTYYYTSRPLLLDSAYNAPSKALSFPGSMLISKQLTVSKVEQINHDTKKITFALPGGNDQISGVPAGAAILTSHTPSGAWFPVFRPYTPISDADERGGLQLLVKQYPGGKASSHLHSLAIGETLNIRGPLPGYSYTPSSEPRDLLLIAGGAGITPIYSLAQGILKNNEDKTRLQLVWGVNGTRDLVLKTELESLAAQHPDRLQISYCISGPESAPGVPSLGDETKYKKGYINKSVLQEAIARCENGVWGDGKTKVWLCGPPAMEEAIAGRQGVLSQLGLQKKEVHKF